MDSQVIEPVLRLIYLGHDSALETLLRYNREDIVNLKPLAGLAYKRLREKTTALRPVR